jgi:uncharacterized DUF497 family protein
VDLVFAWDTRKAGSNLKKHGVAFEEAVSVFGDTLSVTIEDSAHSGEESRCIIVGQSSQGLTLVVVHTERGQRIRIISARVATPRERMQYEETKD